MQEKTTRQILREARRILSQHGKWNRGGLGSTATSMCLLGGIAHAAGIEGNSKKIYSILGKMPAVLAIKDLLVKKDPEKFGIYLNPTTAVYSFNDALGRTQQEVVDLLTETLKSLPKE